MHGSTLSDGIKKTTPPSAFGESVRTPAAMWAGVLLTMLLHAGLVAAVIVGTMQGGEEIQEEIEPRMLKFEKVDLLALGEEKPPNQLPRIVNPEPVVQKPDEVNLAKPEEPVVELEKKEKKEAKEDDEVRKRKMAEALSALHNPHRPTNGPWRTSSVHGWASGTSRGASRCWPAGAAPGPVRGERRPAGVRAASSRRS